MLSNLGWRSLENRRIDRRLAMFHKIVYDLVAITLPSYLERPEVTLASCTLFLADRFTHQSVTTNIHSPTPPISTVLWNM